MAQLTRMAPLLLVALAMLRVMVMECAIWPEMFWNGQVLFLVTSVFTVAAVGQALMPAIALFHIRELICLTLWKIAP